MNLYQIALSMSCFQNFFKYLLINFCLLAFNFALFSQSEIESNNNFNSATTISINTEISAFINIERDNDYFKFNITEPGIITVSVFQVPSNIELDVFMYTPTPDQIEIVKAVNNERGQGYTFEISTCFTGEHFLFFRDGNGDGRDIQGNGFNSQEQYSFQVDFTSFAQEALDIHECNDLSINGAAEINIGERINALIAPHFNYVNTFRDNDYFKFNITEPGIITVSVFQVPSNIELDVFMHTPAPNQIEIVKAVNNERGQGYTFEISTCFTGEHFLFFRDGNGDGRDIQGNGFNSQEQYSFQVDFTSFAQEALDIHECNDLSINGAAEINIGERVNALIAPHFNYVNTFRDNDYFKFNITEPGIITVSVFQVPSNIELDVFMYTPTPDQIEIVKAVNNERGQGYTFEISTCFTGEHFLFFRDGNGDGRDIQGNGFNSQEQYSFQVDFTSFAQEALDIHECNDLSINGAAEINIGERINALIAPHFNYVNTFRDNDYFKFNITEPGIITVSVFQVPSNIELDVFMHTPAPNQIEIVKAVNNERGQGYTFEISTCFTGEHFLFFRDGNGDGRDIQGNGFNSQEQYSFQVDFTSFAQEALDIHECNDLSINGAAEINIGERVNALIAPHFNYVNTFRDNDYFKFNITEPGIITVSVFQVPSNIELDVFMYTPAPNQIEIVKAVNNERGQGYTFEISTCFTGEHFLFFRDGNGDGRDIQGNGFNSQEQYSFQVDFTSFAPIEDCECNNFSFQQACSINSCEPTEAYIAPYFNYNPRNVDNDVYEIALTASKEVDINISSVPSNISICAALYDAQQNQLARYALDDGENLNVTFIPEVTGKYFLTIEDCDGHFNSQDTYEVLIGCNQVSRVQEIDLRTIATIFPNPVSSSFQIKSEQLSGKMITLEVYDIQGQLIKTESIYFSNTMEVDMSHLQNGFYTIRIMTDKENYYSKIVKT